MAVSTLEEATIESPTGYTEAEVRQALVRWDDDPLKAALELWKRRRNEVLSSPGKWGADGDYSEDWSLNMKAIDARVRELQALTDSGSGTDYTLPTVGIAGFTRSDRERL